MVGSVEMKALEAAMGSGKEANGKNTMVPNTIGKNAAHGGEPLMRRKDNARRWIMFAATIPSPRPRLECPNELLSECQTGGVRRRRGQHVLLQRGHERVDVGEAEGF